MQAAGLAQKNVTVGDNTTFGKGTVLWAPNKATIGNNIYIGRYCTLMADMEIVDNTVIGNNVGLIGKYDHDYSKIGVSIKDARRLPLGKEKRNCLFALYRGYAKSQHK